MASSRKSKRSKRVSSHLTAEVAAGLQTVLRPGDRLLLGLSGGVDSIVLLDVLAGLASGLNFELHTLHVNHQLSSNAARWAKFCREVCREIGVPCRVVKVEVARGNSAERAAREARYAAFRKFDADYIALAHNADDQAETVLLQLLRGAGVKGLAAMPFLRCDESARPVIMRPLLDVPRAEIERYAKRHKLAWVEDESNACTSYLRNWLRHDLMPRIASRVPGYRATLTRAARNFAEAAALLEDLARADAADALQKEKIAVERLRELSVGRAKNVLRLLIASRGWPMPEAERLEEALRQALTARGDAKLLVDLGGCVLRRHGAMVYLLPVRSQSVDDAVVTWGGESEIRLPSLGGVLAMTPARGTGLSTGQLQSGPVTIRARTGGERLQPAANRPRRTVKNLLQEADMPVWERDRLPFIYCGDTLACVPGVAIDYRFQARRGEASILPQWLTLDP